jgi:hypothetical protein
VTTLGKQAIAQESPTTEKSHTKINLDQIEALAKAGTPGLCDPQTILALAARVRELQADKQRLSLIIEGERGKAGVAVQSIDKVLSSRDWLRHGRGSYEYDDERWFSEFGEAMMEIEQALISLRPIIANLEDCPHTNDEVRSARAFTLLQSKVEQGQRERDALAAENAELRADKERWKFARENCLMAFSEEVAP